MSRHTRLTLRTIPILFSMALMTSCGVQNKESRVDYTRNAITDELKSDTGIEAFITPYKKHVDSIMDSPISYNPTLLTKTDTPLNTALGNLMARAVYEQAQPVYKSRTGHDIDFVLLNHGGIRSTLNPGPVTTRSAYQLMPFENEIVVTELTRDSIQSLIDYLVEKKRAHPIEGLQLALNSQGKLTSILVNKQPLQDRTYRVATSDYLQQGGDRMTFFGNPVSMERVDYKIRNALLDYFKRQDTIRNVADNRFIQTQ